MEKIPLQSRIEIQKLFLEGRQPSENKTAYAMCGIPGAGKSTFVEQRIKAGVFPQNAFLLNPDKVMKSLPEYQEALRSDGAEKAFEIWEMPARLLAYDLFHKAIAQSVDIIIDMGCVRAEDMNNILTLKRHSYDVLMFYIYCSLDIAQERITTRMRHTPISMLKEREASLDEFLPKYRLLANKFAAYDNSNLQSPFSPMNEIIKKAV